MEFNVLRFEMWFAGLVALVAALAGGWVFAAVCASLSAAAAWSDKYFVASN